MDDEAIQKDALAATQETEQSSAPTETAVPESPAQPEDPRSKRERRMAEVSAKRIEEREEGRKSAALMNDPDLTEEEFNAQQVAAKEAEAASDADAGEHAEHGGELTTAEESPAKADVPQSVDAAPAGWDRREDGVLVKKLKVNGEIRELTQDEYDRQLSKDLAGDQKLRQAAQKEQQLRALEQELHRRAQEASQPPQVDADLDAELRDAVGAIYDGDSDAAIAKLKAVVMQGRQSSTPNMDQLASQVTTQVKASIEEERRREGQISGWNKFRTEYSDIAASEPLLAAADVILKEVQADNPDWDAEQLYMETGRKTRERLKEMGFVTGSDDKPAPRADVDRMDRKANLKPVPKSGSAVVAKPKEPVVDMSAAGKIARMRQMRALA